MRNPAESPASRYLDPAPASAFTVAAGLVAVVPFVTLGALSSHMLLHIVSMSVAAPLLAAGWTRLGPHRDVGSRELWTATALQIVTLWAWHLPAAHHAAASSTAGTLAMHASLFAAALWFWLSLIQLGGAQRWQGILALLITGKLACLLAGLLVFAPRSVFVGRHHMVHALDDQHLAGLLMMVACPASYVLAGVLMAVHVVGVVQPAKPRSS